MTRQRGARRRRVGWRILELRLFTSSLAKRHKYRPREVWTAYGIIIIIIIIIRLDDIYRTCNSYYSSYEDNVQILLVQYRNLHFASSSSALALPVQYIHYSNAPNLRITTAAMTAWHISNKLMISRGPEYLFQYTWSWWWFADKRLDNKTDHVRPTTRNAFRKDRRGV